MHQPHWTMIFLVKTILCVRRRLAAAAKQANQVHAPPMSADGKKPKPDKYGDTKFFPVIGAQFCEDQCCFEPVAGSVSRQFRLAPGHSFEDIKAQMFDLVYQSNVVRTNQSQTLYFLTKVKRMDDRYDGTLLLPQSFQRGSSDFIDFLKNKRNPLFGCITTEHTASAGQKPQTMPHTQQPSSHLQLMAPMTPLVHPRPLNLALPGGKRLRPDDSSSPVTMHSFQSSFSSVSVFTSPIPIGHDVQAPEEQVPAQVSTISASCRTSRCVVQLQLFVFLVFVTRTVFQRS